MGMMLPGDLVWVLDKLGFEWPNLDEDEIHRAADLVRRFKDELDGLVTEADRHITVTVTEAMRNKASGSYADAWTHARSQHLGQLIDLLDPVAVGIDIFADAVLALKVKVAAQLAETAFEIAEATAAAFVTLGASLAVEAGIIEVKKKAMQVLTNLAVEELMNQLMPIVLEPLTNLVPTIVDALLDAPLVSGAVAEVQSFQTDYAALEQTASDLDRNADEHERIVDSFLSRLGSLQIVGS